MNNINLQPRFYFAAYPLKAITLPKEEKKTDLKIISNKEGVVTIKGSSKVLPMINPYLEKNILNTKRTIAKNGTKISITPDNIQHSESEWFSCYE